MLHFFSKHEFKHKKKVINKIMNVKILVLNLMQTSLKKKQTNKYNFTRVLNEKIIQTVFSVITSSVCLSLVFLSNWVKNQATNFY